MKSKTACPMLLQPSTSASTSADGLSRGFTGQLTTCSLCCFFLMVGRVPHAVPLLWGDVVGSLPQPAALQKLLQLLQHGSFPWAVVLQEQVQHGVTSPACKLAPVWTPVSRGPARSLQLGLPTGSQPSSGIHMLQCGALHGLQRDCLTHQGLQQGWK